ncbi:type IV pilus secretin PilQ [Ectothiorhodospiraceae bacterium 2226]|nr:type IV pilus secretin PilQ [Ectothiorhodospiraceae bacterium 2226]
MSVRSFSSTILTGCARHTVVGLLVLLSGVLLAGGTAIAADEVALQDVSVAALPGNRVELKFTMSGPAPSPNTFTIDNPARLALDLPGTRNALATRSRTIGTGAARSMTVVEAGGRTRVVLNLARLVPFETRTEGNQLYLVLEAAGGGAGVPATARREVRVNDIDFRRGDAGEGLVVVRLGDPNMAVDVQRTGNRLVAEFQNATLPQELERSLDVADFATPVKSIDTYAQGNNVRMVVTPDGPFEYGAYQVEDRFTLAVKVLPSGPSQDGVVGQPKYTGERLSLNFQDIEVRALLQVLADFNDVNLVTTDSVSGSLTLRLQNVPWDQAMDIILNSRGLGMRQHGNVWMVAPAAEIAARERAELEARQGMSELVPLMNEAIQINYARAQDIASLLRNEQNTLLSGRGNIAVDARTNQLLLLDTPDHIEAVRNLVAQLDVPVRQVLIESRVVLASNDFSRELGVKFGVSGDRTTGSHQVGVGGNIGGADTARRSGIDATTPPDRLNVNFPVTSLSGSAGTIGLAVANLRRGILLDLELSAAQAEGRSETVSSPRVITANQREAVIKQGVEIPFTVPGTANNPPTVQFKEALLALTVTPQITPDDRIIMSLQINKDSPDFGSAVQGNPPINKQEVQTQVLVDNGETVVLGGIYEQTKATSVRRVPFFSDLPLIGVLFRNTFNQDDRSELLVFVTPKILSESLSGQ